MITLIIVDCQNDFISGTMAVNGAKEVVNNIKNFINENKDEIEKIIFTLDWHPYNHCSFKKEGGKWPIHCVQHTPGACIDSKLLKLVQASGISFQFSLKGQEGEQYGAFEDAEIIKDYLGTRIRFDTQSDADITTDFIICGIAGDYCVKETIENLLKYNIVPKILMSGIASIDNGKVINKYIEVNQLEKYEELSNN